MSRCNCYQYAESSGVDVLNCPVHGTKAKERKASVAARLKALVTTDGHYCCRDCGQPELQAEELSSILAEVEAVVDGLLAYGPMDRYEMKQFTDRLADREET